jgi:hypothetical protein
MFSKIPENRDRKKLFEIYNYKIKENILLGEGSGKVYSVHRKFDNKIFAAKKIQTEAKDLCEKLANELEKMILIKN